MSPSFLRRLVRQGYFWLKGYPLYAVMSELQHSQYRSRAELAAIQDAKVHRLIRHVYETVPFYRRRMDEYGLKPSNFQTVADMSRFPILTRKEIRDNGPELLTTAGSVGKPVLGNTGGTTGEPVQTWNDLRGIVWGIAAYYRGLGWAGYDLDRDRLAILFGGSLKKGRSILGSGRWWQGLTLSLSSYDVRPDTIREYYQRLSQFQPRFLKGYAQSTYLLARGFAEAGFPPLRLAGVFTTSEHLPLYQRRYIENVFETRVFDYYGCVEVYSLGYECDRHDSYHVPEEHVLVETMEDAHEEAGAGGGAFVLTDLDNYYMPIIRYRNGDAGQLTEEPCSCGRTLKRIARLHGRISDLLRNTDGTLVDGGVIDYVLGKTRHVREYCLIQESERECRLQYVADRTDHEIPEVVDQLRQFLGQDMCILTESVEHIPLTKSGKRRFTMSRLRTDGEEAGPASYTT
jgi:phenylacetate-CoA ligase